MLDLWYEIELLHEQEKRKIPDLEIKPMLWNCSDELDIPRFNLWR